jgi:CheY-like chemotaxis protein
MTTNQAKKRIRMTGNHHLETSRRHFITTAGAGAAGITLFPATRLWSAVQTGGDSSANPASGKLRFALCNEMFEQSTMADVCGIISKLGYQGIEIAPYTLAATADAVIPRTDVLRPDIVLMDGSLEGTTNRIEAAHHIKHLHDIPIIFVTANADEPMVRRAIAAGLDGFLIKPLDALELRAAIEMTLYRHSADAKTHESDHHLRELIESLSEVIFETDLGLRHPGK